MYVVNRLNIRNTHVFLWNMPKGNHLAKKDWFFLLHFALEGKHPEEKQKCQERCNCAISKFTV